MVTETDTTTGLNDDTVTTSQTNTQEGAKTFTQDEVNDMMAKQKGNITRKVSQQYEDLGSVEELAKLKSDADAAKQATQIEKGEFEQALQDLASKKDDTISKLKNEINEFRVNGPLIDAAAKHRSNNPEQVRDLLKDSVRLDNNGEAEIIDKEGKVVYNEDGTRQTVDQKVVQFLDESPWFAPPTKSTTNTKTNINNANSSNFDWDSADMSNPDVRARFKKDKNI